MPKKNIKHNKFIDTIVEVKAPVIIPVKKDSVTTPSLFQNHLLSVKYLKPQLHITQYDYWITGILLFLYVMFVWVYISNRKKLSQIIRGFYQTRFTNENARDDFSIGNRVSVFLSVFFIITLTIFSTQALDYYDIRLFNNSSREVLMAIVITAVYAVKFATINLVGFVFQVQKEAKELMMSVFLFCNALGLFMLPLVICLSFVKQISPVVFIYMGIAIIGTFILIRIVRGILIGLKSQRVSRFYLFMYLCTLEILPFILMVKLVILKIK